MTTAHTDTDRPDFLDGIALLHDAMRRDVDRLPLAIERVASLDHARALARWFAKFEREVEHHHLREDEVVWPMLLERAPDFREPLGPLEDDHHALDVAMARARLALAALTERVDDATLATAMEAAGSLRDLLRGHLDREEDVAFPWLAATFTPEAFAALEQQLLKATSKRLIAFELPFVFDGQSAASAAEMLADLPLLIRGLYRLRWQPAYDRLVAPLAGLPQLVTA